MQEFASGALKLTPKPSKTRTLVQTETNARERWRRTTFIELIVDGGVVDLNRILLPADTPIVEMRFSDADNK